MIKQKTKIKDIMENKEILSISKKFNEQSKKLLKIDIPKKISYGIHWNIDTGLKNKEDFWADNKMSEILMCLRFFIIKKNNNFNLDKMLDMFIENDFMIEDVKKIKEEYSGVMNDETTSLVYNDSEITNKNNFNTMLNENYFHQEIEKKGMLKINSNRTFGNASTFKFQSTVADIIQIIRDFNEKIILKFIKEQEKKQSKKNPI